MHHLLDELGVKRVDFIKIDAEGAELDILKGAERTLRTGKPFLAIATYHTPSETEEVAKYLHKKDFKIIKAIIHQDSYIYAFKP